MALTLALTYMPAIAFANGDVADRGNPTDIDFSHNGDEYSVCGELRPDTEWDDETGEEIETSPEYYHYDIPGFAEGDTLNVYYENLEEPVLYEAQWRSSGDSGELIFVSTEDPQDILVEYEDVFMNWENEQSYDSQFEADSYENMTVSLYYTETEYVSDSVSAYLYVDDEPEEAMPVRAEFEGDLQGIIGESYVNLYKDGYKVTVTYDDDSVEEYIYVEIDEDSGDYFLDGDTDNKTLDFIYVDDICNDSGVLEAGDNEILLFIGVGGEEFFVKATAVGISETDLLPDELRPETVSLELKGGRQLRYNLRTWDLNFPEAGDKVTVTYGDGSEKTYTAHDSDDELQFIDNDGNMLEYEPDYERELGNQPFSLEIKVEYDDDYYRGVFETGVRCNVYTDVKSISFVPHSKYILYEGVDSELDGDTDSTGKYVEYNYYCCQPVKENDELIVTLNNGSVIHYTAEKIGGEVYLINDKDPEEYLSLESDEVSARTDQSVNNQWKPGKTYSGKLVYAGKETTFSVEIKSDPNPLKSIQFVSAAGMNDFAVSDFGEYGFDNDLDEVRGNSTFFTEGDKLILKYANGTSKEYVYDGDCFAYKNEDNIDGVDADWQELHEGSNVVTIKLKEIQTTTTITITDRDHKCVIDAVPARAATYEDEGNIAHYRCRICGKIYHDKTGENPYDSHEDIVIPPLDAATAAEAAASAAQTAATLAQNAYNKAKTAYDNAVAAKGKSNALDLADAALDSIGDADEELYNANEAIEYAERIAQDAFDEAENEDAEKAAQSILDGLKELREQIEPLQDEISIMRDDAHDVRYDAFVATAKSKKAARAAAAENQRKAAEAAAAAKAKAAAAAKAKAAAAAKAKALAAAKAKASNVDKPTVTAADIKKASNLGLTSITLGPKVKKIKKNAFKGTKITTVTVKTKKLKAKAVKGSLKGSKVKTVLVKVGNKKANKKFVKKYKKIFTKKNAGKKVKVK